MKHRTDRALCAAVLLACGGLTLACADADQPEQVVVLQLFRAESPNPGALEVQASQGAASGTTTLAADFFDSCETNRIHIIPSRDGDGFPDVTVRVGKAGDTQVLASWVIGVPARNPVQRTIPGGGPVIPTACAPTHSDAGVGDGGVDAGPTKATGEACSASTECVGGQCLSELWNGGPAIDMPGGYCTRGCDAVACDGDDTCFQMRDGIGPQGKVCLKTCAAAAECRQQEQYTCIPTGSVCLPN